MTSIAWANGMAQHSMSLKNMIESFIYTVIVCVLPLPPKGPSGMDYNNAHYYLLLFRGLWGQENLSTWTNSPFWSRKETCTRKKGASYEASTN